MVTTPPLSPDLAAAAAEALDLWQEHLTACAGNPEARAELMRMMEPQRQLFAEWATMMQTGAATLQPKANDAPTYPPVQPQPTAAPSDDSALRLAQLAHRVAALEHTVDKLTQQLAAANAGSGKTENTYRRKPKKP